MNPSFDNTSCGNVLVILDRSLVFSNGFEFPVEAIRISAAADLASQWCSNYTIR